MKTASVTRLSTTGDLRKSDMRRPNSKWTRGNILIALKDGSFPRGRGATDWVFHQQLSRYLGWEILTDSFGKKLRPPQLVDAGFSVPPASENLESALASMPQGFDILMSVTAMSKEHTAYEAKVFLIVSNSEEVHREVRLAGETYFDASKKLPAAICIALLTR